MPLSYTDPLLFRVEKAARHLSGLRLYSDSKGVGGEEVEARVLKTQKSCVW